MAAPIIDNDRRMALGKEIYETKIKHLVDPQEYGKFLVLDITTCDYTVNRDLIAAEDELKARYPEAIMYIVRVGHRAPFRIRSPRIVYDTGKP